MDNNIKIGIYTIATNKYISYVDQLVNTININFFPNKQKKILLFTNVDYHNTLIKISKIDRFGFPLDSMFRFKWYLKESEYFSDCDYVFFIDCDMKVIDVVNFDLTSDYTCVRHPSYYNSGGTFEEREHSTAYVKPEFRDNYIQACFFGAKKQLFDIMAAQIDQNMIVDFSKNTIAVWHDESHLNSYIKHKNVQYLDSGYCYPENWNIPFHKRIIHLAKNHSEIREI